MKGQPSFWKVASPSGPDQLRMRISRVSAAMPVPRGGGVRLLVADDAALRPLLREAVVPVHEVVAPHPGLDAFLLQVAVDLEHVVGVERARVLPPAARAEGPRPPLVVADVHPLRAKHVDVLVEDVEEDPVGLRVRGAIGVRPRHVGVLGHVAPGGGDVVGVAQRLHLGDDLEAVSFGPLGEMPHVVLLDVAAAADPDVERGGEAPGGPERDPLAQLVHRLAVGVPLGDRAPPAGADLGMRLETHASAHLEHDAVVLEAQQEVPEVAPREAELVAARQVQVHPAHGQERPVAHERPAHGDALLAPPVDELDEGRDAVEGAAVVASGHDGARRCRSRAGSPRPPRAPSPRRARRPRRPQGRTSRPRRSASVPRAPSRPRPAARRRTGRPRSRPADAPATAPAGRPPARPPRHRSGAAARPRSGSPAGAARWGTEAVAARPRGRRRRARRGRRAGASLMSAGVLDLGAGERAAVGVGVELACLGRARRRLPPCRPSLSGRARAGSSRPRGSAGSRSPPCRRGPPARGRRGGRSPRPAGPGPSAREPGSSCRAPAAGSARRGSASASAGCSAPCCARARLHSTWARRSGVRGATSRFFGYSRARW